jgi:hypothetical protein
MTETYSRRIEELKSAVKGEKSERFVYYHALPSHIGTATYHYHTITYHPSLFLSSVDQHYKRKEIVCQRTLVILKVTIART